VQIGNNITNSYPTSFSMNVYILHKKRHDIYNLVVVDIFLAALF
jgi:hypothetical protein